MEPETYWYGTRPANEQVKRVIDKCAHDRTSVRQERRPWTPPLAGGEKVGWAHSKRGGDSEDGVNTAVAFSTLDATDVAVAMKPAEFGEAALSPTRANTSTGLP